MIFRGELAEFRPCLKEIRPSDAPHIKPLFDAHMKRVWEAMIVRMNKVKYKGKRIDGFGRAHAAWCMYGVVLRTLWGQNPYIRLRLQRGLTIPQMVKLTGLSRDMVIRMEYFGASYDAKIIYRELGMTPVDSVHWHGIRMMQARLLRRLVTAWGKSEPHLDAAWVDLHKGEKHRREGGVWQSIATSQNA